MKRSNAVVGAGVRYAYARFTMRDHSKAEYVGGTPRATKRPAHVKAPAAWQNSPVPVAEPIREDPAADQPGGRNPVRYGDWELKGIAVDF